MPIPGEQPDLAALPPDSSPVKRRLAAQYVREARDRLDLIQWDPTRVRPRAATAVRTKQNFGFADNPASCRDRWSSCPAYGAARSLLGVWTAAALVIHAVTDHQVPAVS